MNTITAFRGSPDWGFDQTFMYRQSSLCTTFSLVKRLISSNPTVVIFEAAISEGVGEELGWDGSQGHET
jgi:hypothetical protein